MLKRRSATVAVMVWLMLPAAALGAAAKPSYVALGDSYASGTGTGVFYRADASCDQSRYAYPPLLAHAKGYALSFAACSGATSASLISTQLHDLSRSTALVTVEVGGNDAGLVPVLEACALSGSSCAKAITTADRYIQHSLPAVLSRTYADIRAAAPRAQVIVVGYPRLFTPRGAGCGLHLLSSADEKSLNQTADLLDGVIARETRSHRFRFLDPRSAFAGHEICSRSPWINGLVFPRVQESFHPNVAGEAGYASLLERLVGGSAA